MSAVIACGRFACGSDKSLSGGVLRLALALGPDNCPPRGAGFSIELLLRGREMGGLVVLIYFFTSLISGVLLLRSLARFLPQSMRPLIKTFAAASFNA